MNLGWSYRVFAGHEPVTHPPPGGSISADVREAAVVVPVRGAERDLLDGLVDDETSGLVVHDSKPVPADVENRPNGFPL